MSSSSDYRYVIACPECGARLKLRDADLGRQRACPKCTFAIQTPDLETARRRWQQDQVRREFSFICRLCGTRLYARPDQIGATIRCPDCHTDNVVASPPKPTERKRFMDETDLYELQPLDDDFSRPAEDEQLFRFRCPVCESLLYGRRERVGEPITCHDCGSSLVVPKPPPPKKRAPVSAEDPGIIVAAPSDRKELETNVGQIMARARQRVLEREREIPQPPRRPFVSGLFLFPFYGSVAPTWVVQSMVLSLILWLVTAAFEMTGKMQIIGIFLMIIASVLSFVLIVLAAVCWMTIIQWTAMGYPTVREWPAVEIFEWLWKTFFLISAFGLSVAPGALLASVLPGGLGRALYALPFAFLLFPFVLLSMLDADSPFVPFTRFIHGSITAVPRAWVIFYAQTFLLLVVVAVPQAVAALVPDERSWQYVSIVVLMIATTLYFRLLGRLAWYINEKVR
jgi:DNA-directed RNA polymerase subunit M/transcription elongation factor TFIIS